MNIISVCTKDSDGRKKVPTCIHCGGILESKWRQLKIKKKARAIYGGALAIILSNLYFFSGVNCSLIFDSASLSVFFKKINMNIQ